MRGPFSKILGGPGPPGPPRIDAPDYKYIFTYLLTKVIEYAIRFRFAAPRSMTLDDLEV